jgi:anhydro-N-acetylmuramic acid kinase
MLSSSPPIYIGVMSGTSLDGVDIAAVHIHDSGHPIEVVAFETTPFPKSIHDDLRNRIGVAQQHVGEIVAIHKALGVYFADAVHAFIQRHDLKQVRRIGLHGLTLWHQADPLEVLGTHQRGTLQIGDPYLMALKTQTPVVHDLRNADMAVGGEGAPLAPFLDMLLFASKTENRVLLNLGGIANATFIPAASEAPIAFDTGPANMIIDALMEQHPTQPARYDAGGQVAARGTIIKPLLNDCLKHPYFARPVPKTTGRELFGTPFLKKFTEYPGPHTHEDLIATATAFTAQTIADAVVMMEKEQDLQYQRIIAAGGGTHNPTLIQMIADALPRTIPIDTTGDHGIDPDTKEAVLFAALAWAHEHRRSANFASVSGARQQVILGSLYEP